MSEIAERVLVGEKKADDVRGRCPDCGGLIVSRVYYVTGRGYVIVWEGAEQGCNYRRVL